jgi:head-tail adaptor
MHYSAGRFKNFLTLQKKIVTRTAGGGSTFGWQNVDQMYAIVEPLLGGASMAYAGSFYADQNAPIIDYRVVIYYRTDTVGGMQLVDDDDGTIYTIRRAPVDVDNAHMYLELYCEQVQVTGN